MALPSKYGAGNVYPPAASTRILSNGADATRPVLIGEPRRSTNEFGASELTRKYKIKYSLLSKFEPKLGQVDFRYPSLVYWDHEVTETPTYAVVTVRFNGFMPGQKERTIKPEYDSQYQKITVTNGPGAQVTMVYISPIVTARYASSTRPDDNERFAIIPDKARMSFYESAQTISLIDIARTTAEAERKYKIKSKVERPTFTRTPQGSLWMCTEVIHRIFCQQTIDFRA